MKVGILYIGIGNYTLLWEDFFKSAEKYLFPNVDKQYFLFTDKELSVSKSVSVYYQKDLGGYNNTLYYPHHETVLDGDKGCAAYWLASPNDCYYKDYVTVVMSNGGDVMGYPYDAYGETGMALRPIVSLNSEITVNATDAE